MIPKKVKNIPKITFKEQNFEKITPKEKSDKWWTKFEEKNSKITTKELALNIHLY